MDAADLQKIKPHLCPAALLIDMAAAFLDYETTSELDHRAGSQVESHAARMGELLPDRNRHQGVSGDRSLHRCAVTPVVAHQGQAKQGRDLSTLAPLRALRVLTALGRDVPWAKA
jgi:hypothetical protein